MGTPGSSRDADRHGLSFGEAWLVGCRRMSLISLLVLLIKALPYSGDLIVIVAGSGHHVEEPEVGGTLHPGHTLPPLALDFAPGVLLEGKTRGWKAFPRACQEPRAD